MKNVKILGLLVMAAVSLLAFASSASAATLTSPSGTEYTGEIHATLEKGTTALLKAGIEDTCTESTAKGSVNNNTTHAAGGLSVLTFGSCTQDTNTIAPGSLTINNLGEVFTFANEVEVKVTSLGITCLYGGGPSPGTKIGTLTAGTPAKLAVSTTQLKRLPGSSTFFCSETGTWTASYVVTTPGTLLTDFSSPAAVLTSPAGTEYTGEIDASLEKGTTLLLKAGIENTCTESTALGTITENTSIEAQGPLSALTFGACTQDTKTINPGKLTINDAGEVFTKESRVEVKVTSLGISCFYGAETGSVKLGTLTGGTPAKIDVSTTTLQREAGSSTFFCAETGTWTGTYSVTTPSTLLLT